MTKNSKSKSLFPFFVLMLLILYGMVIRPQALDKSSMPLELIFVFASIITIFFMLINGISWEEIQKSVGEKTLEALPAIHMLLAIGLLVGAWVFSGTIPMLVYYGLKIINPNLIYVIALFLCALFSILTGTSWGSAGTIGIVLIAIGSAINANQAILASAIISGCYFGDKQSPISDTTIMAAMGAGVDVRDHVSSMLRTTGPSIIISAIIYLIIGIVYPVKSVDTSSFVEPILLSLDSIFNFNILLLLPPIIILVGSIMRKPSLVATLSSVVVACILGLAVQNFTFDNMYETLTNGFNIDMITWSNNIPESVSVILTRGGMASMTNAVTITIWVFIFIGAINVLNTMEVLMDSIFTNINTRSKTIIASQISSAIINGTTSNQYATAMIVGNAFKQKYRDQKIPLKVLSRSIEDFGTMIEPLLPWTTTGIYMSTTLGVPYAEYVPFMFMHFINFVIAIIWAITGKNCFYDEIENI
ncbi:Na+/H+ antiporter NhaC [Anaerococcus obesiensis]|uniref:Na+/H+ antiporter NhaC n=1 Tax=Anaerococcus obesiensis TaxID=1287640 RepID=UPI0002DD40C3|nr:Na+/H+ antiporter NhaC [Anaerococcus obesiensis]